MSVADPLVLRDGDRAGLETMVESGAADTDLVRRARILLLAAEGLSNAEVARRTGTSRSTVEDWRSRYARGGVPALADLPRSGRPVKVDEIEVVLATLVADGRPPTRLGATYWSARLLGAELGIPFATVARIWRKWGMQPWRADGLEFSTAPDLEAGLGDVVAVYLNPPTNAIVMCIDEKVCGQVPDPTLPARPPGPGVVEGRTGDHSRSDASSFSGLLRLGTRKDSDSGLRLRYDTGAGLPAFLTQVAAAHPIRELHVVVEHHGTGERPAVNAWLRDNPRMTVHFTSTPGSWLKLVEALCAAVSRRAVGCGEVDSAAELTRAVGAFVDDRSHSGRPFVWMKEPQPVSTPQVVQGASQRTSGPGTTEELFAVAFDAVHTCLDALESATGRVAVSPEAVIELTAAVQGLRARLGAVEAAGGGPRPSPGRDAGVTEPGRETAQRDVTREEVIPKSGWLLDHLEENAGPMHTRGDVSGSIALGGVLRAPGSGAVRWQAEYTVPDILGANPAVAAAMLAAMGHPLRLELLRLMLLGACTVGEFQQIRGIGTRNQVHHHLRELRPAELVVSATRNHYAIPPARVVPVLVIVGACLGRRVVGRAGLEPIVKTAPPGEAAGVAQAGEYWMLDHLEGNTGPAFTQGELSGSIAFGGALRVPGPGRWGWQSEYTVPDVLAADLPSAAMTLAALGNSLRLELLRRILLGARTVAEFQQIDGIGSTGQVHHHLRELRAAGLVVATKRNHYTIPGDRVVHLVVILGAALGRRVIGRAGRDPA